MRGGELAGACARREDHTNDGWSGLWVMAVKAGGRGVYGPVYTVALPVR